MTIINRRFNEAVRQYRKKYILAYHATGSLSGILSVYGDEGCGKTTAALALSKEIPSLYFSFKGLTSHIAMKLISECIRSVFGMNEHRQPASWQEVFLLFEHVEEPRCRTIFLDDMDSILSDVSFVEAAQEYLGNRGHRMMFFVMLMRRKSPDWLDRAGKSLRLYPFDLATAVKASPNLTRLDVCRVHTITDGLPKLMMPLIEEETFEEVLRSLFRDDSDFVNYADHLLQQHFREDAVYRAILFAIAAGNCRVSEIGKWIGESYTKCSKYLNVLIRNGLVYPEKVTGVNSKVKTAYRISSNYLAFWFRYIYPNRRDILLENTAGLIERIGEEIDRIFTFPAFHQICHGYLRERWHAISPAGMSCPDIFKPRSVVNRNTGDKFAFDVAVLRGSSALLAKIHVDAIQTFGKDEYLMLDKYLSAYAKYRDKVVVIFSINRFTEYVVNRASEWDDLKLVIPDRMSFNS